MALQPSIIDDRQDEAARQRAVDRSSILSRRDAAFQTIVEEACWAYRTPMAAISIIDHDRQWFVAQHGLGVSETPRGSSFCAHTIQRLGEALLVPDAKLDKRFSANPLVVDAPFIRFYAGMALVDKSGYALGALCIIDTAPRTESPDLLRLADLARTAERLINR